MFKFFMATFIDFRRFLVFLSNFRTEIIELAHVCVAVDSSICK